MLKKDEMQLRDKYCEFILIIFKEILVKYKHIKIVLIGSTLNPDYFQKYFNHCPILIGKITIGHNSILKDKS